MFNLLSIFKSKPVVEVRVANDFTTTTGGAFKKHGGYSGQLFYETILMPKYIEARNKNAKLLVDLDGTIGYGSGFLVASFGVLGVIYGSKEVMMRIRFKSDEEPYLIEEIHDYINGRIP
jgi:hypothetical protein